MHYTTSLVLLSRVFWWRSFHGFAAKRSRAGSADQFGIGGNDSNEIVSTTKTAGSTSVRDHFPGSLIPNAYMTTNWGTWMRIHSRMVFTLSFMKLF